MRRSYYVCELLLACFLYAGVATAANPPQPIPAFDYSSYLDVTATLTGLAAANPDIAQVFSIGATYEGRQQWVLHLTDFNNTATKPAIWFSCCIHARERIPVQVGLAFTTTICTYKTDPAITSLLHNLDIYVMPMSNPDGVTYNGCCQSVTCWRKNMELHHERAYESSIPENGSGTDPNRTWDYEWDYAGDAKIDQMVAYRGDQPVLAPMIHNIRKFTNTLLPRLVANIDCHSASGSVYYIYNGKYDSVADAYHRNLLMAVAKGMGVITGYTVQEGNVLYLSAGDTNDAQEVLSGFMSFTIETAYGVDNLFPYYSCELFTPPYPSDATTIDINNNVQAWIYLLNVVNNGLYTNY